MKQDFEPNTPQETTTPEESTIFSTAGREPVGKVKKKTSVKMLVALLLAVLVLVGIIISVVVLIPKNEEGGGKESASIMLTESGLGVLKSVHVKNPSGEYTLVPFHSEEDDEVYLKLQGYDNIPQNYEMTTQIGDYVFGVEAYRKLDDKWTEADCGLDKPAITVTVTLEDGKSFTIRLGNKVPEGTGYYCATSLQDGIYLVADDHYTRFSYELTSYVNTVLMEPWSAEGETDAYFDESSGKLYRFESITYTGSRLNKPIKLVYESDPTSSLLYRLTSPTETYADDEAVSTLLTPFNDGLTAADAYVFNPTAADLKKYGLDNPETVLTYVVRDKTITIKVGRGPDYDEGYSAVLFNDNPVIYKFTRSIAEFLNWTDKDLRNNFLFIRDIKGVSSLTYELKGEKPIKYDISVYTYNDDTSKEPVYTITQNAQKVDDESFRNLYGAISLVKAASYLEETTPVQDDDVYFTLTYTYNNGDSPDVLTFSKYSERFYRYTINGKGDELINYTMVENLVDLFTDFIAGKEVGSPY